MRGMDMVGKRPREPSALDDSPWSGCAEGGGGGTAHVFNHHSFGLPLVCFLTSPYRWRQERNRQERGLRETLAFTVL